MSHWRRWQDWVIVALGVITFVTPFVFDATAVAAALRAPLIIGALLFLVGLWALSNPEETAIEWIQVVLAVVLFIVPWVFTYTGLNNMSWSAWIIGAVTFMLSGWVILRPGEEAQPALTH